MAVIDGMEEKEQREFDSRLYAPERGPVMPSQGVQQLWGVMGRPAVAPGAIPVAPGARPAVAPEGRPVAARPRVAEKIGGGD